MFRNTLNRLVFKRNVTYVRFNNRSPMFAPTPAKLRGLGITGGLLGLFYVSNLNEAPISHRKRFLWISEGLEKKIGDFTYKQLLSEYQGKLLPKNHPLNKKIEKIFKRLLIHSDLANSDIDWEINVINDPELPPNAFVLPNGKIFIFSSMISICANDDGLATVLGHEFAHKLARHTGEQMSKAPIYIMLSLLLDMAFGSSGNLHNLLISTLFKLPASREMESEADYIGLMLMSKACFEPAESIKLWQRMKQYESSHGGMRVAEFLSTHPGNERRIDNLTKWQAEARSLKDQNCIEYQRFF